MQKKKIKLLIVEESDVIRNGLTAILADKNNAAFIIEQDSNKSDIQYLIHKVSPKILIASPDLIEQNQQLINNLKEKYNMLTVGLVYSFQHPNSLLHYDGLIYINDEVEQIQSTIKGLLKSHTVIKTMSSVENLTNREKEILKLLVHGNTTKQIANSLHISTHTVNAHRKNIMRKLDIKTVSGLTIYAVLNNIISLKEV